MSEPAVHSDATLRRRRRLSLTWAAVVVIWSLVRAIIVWAAVGDYGLNPWIYLVIDLCSASVDAFTTPRMVLRFIDDHFRKAAGWALVSLGAFIVPDIYIFVGSRTLPKKLVVIMLKGSPQFSIRIRSAET